MQGFFVCECSCARVLHMHMTCAHVCTHTTQRGADAFCSLSLFETSGPELKHVCWPS